MFLSVYVCICVYRLGVSVLILDLDLNFVWCLFATVGFRGVSN